MKTGEVVGGIPFTRGPAHLLRNWFYIGEVMFKGDTRIHGELLKLGFDVSQATVSRYMPRRSGNPSQGWRSFLRNQAAAVGIINFGEVDGLPDQLRSLPAGSSGLSGTPPRGINSTPYPTASSTMRRSIADTCIPINPPRLAHSRGAHE